MNLLVVSSPGSLGSSVLVVPHVKVELSGLNIV